MGTSGFVGIEQRCPMSGNLWAVAVDLVVRFLNAAAVASVTASLTVCADDVVAVAAAHLVEAWRWVFLANGVVSPPSRPASIPTRHAISARRLLSRAPGVSPLLAMHATLAYPSRPTPSGMHGRVTLGP